MSEESNSFTIKTCFYGLLITISTISFKILITNKTINYETSPTSHPYLICLLFFIGKSINLIIFFFTDNPDEPEEELPLGKLTPNVSSASISLPKLNFSSSRGDFSFSKTKSRQIKRVSFSPTIAFLPSLIHYFSILLKCFSLFYVNSGLYQFIYMTIILNYISIKIYNMTSVFSIQMIIGYIISYICILIGILYYIIIGDKYQSFGIALLLVSNILHGIVLYMNVIIIEQTTKTNEFQLNGIEGVLSLIISVVIVICGCNISCEGGDFKRSMFCGGNMTMENIGSFISGDYDNGLRYLYAFVFVVSVFVYYCGEKIVKSFDIERSDTAICIVCLVIGGGIWGLFSFVERMGIVKEDIHIIDIIIGIGIFVGLLIGGHVIQIKCLSPKISNDTIQEVSEDEQDY